MDRNPPSHFGRSNISNRERFGCWIRYHRDAALVAVVVLAACAGGSTYLLVHASRYKTVPVSVAPVIEASSPDVSPPPTLPAGGTEFTPLTSPPTTRPASPKGVPTTLSSKVKADSVPSRPGSAAASTTTTTRPAPSTTVATVTSTGSHLQPVTTTIPAATTTTLPSLSTWYNAHHSDVAALQAADENLWTTALGEVSEGPKADLTSLIAQDRQAVAAMTKDLPADGYPTVDQALTTLTQAAQDFVSWQESPSGPGFHDGAAALFNGDAAIYQALVGAGVPATSLRPHL